MRAGRGRGNDARHVHDAFWGGGRFSPDGWYLRRTANLDGRLPRLAGLSAVARGGRRDRGLLVIRLGIVYTLAHPGSAPWRVRQPDEYVSAATDFAARGGRNRGGDRCPLPHGWDRGVAPGRLDRQPRLARPLIGAERVKRELALAVIAAVYAAAGSDGWTPPDPRRLRCSEVSDLLAASLFGELSPQRRCAVEFHLADCPDCWAYLGSYRQTIALGKDLREVDMPAEVYERLYALVAGGADDKSEPTGP